MQSDNYDVIIIGSGPAGLSAGIYCARAGLKTLMFEKFSAGGQLLRIENVENYPGFPGGISGFELVEKMKLQARNFGVMFEMEEAVDIKSGIQVRVASGKTHNAKSAIIATGARPKKLDIKGEAEFEGRGVSYCATCDGPLFKNKEVVVVGGGDTAIVESIYLMRLVRKLTLVHRRDALRAAKSLQDKVLKENKAEIKWNSVPEEILGDKKVSGIRIRDIKINKISQVQADGVFIFVGLQPQTEFLKGKLDLDEKGFIVTGPDLKTSLPGVFACGDATNNTFKQIVTSCSQGATAAHACWRYVEGLG
ncbi:MAG: thioredoxin-disulfide reductase [Candidatus Omnitrophica bacterium]|nr:thioredoxin-disulfide reductase [Candidatus Omnitrophota bacterium]